MKIQTNKDHSLILGKTDRVKEGESGVELVLGAGIHKEEGKEIIPF
jgi:hypothetical protein